MFDKLQQIKKAKQLYDQAKMLEKAAAAEIETVEEGGIKVVASGDQKIQKIVVDGEELKDITKVVNKALDKAKDTGQKAAMKKLQEMGGGDLRSEEHTSSSH